MATIIQRVEIAAPVERVWDALADFGAVHQKLARGFVVEARLDGPTSRVVTFANGLVAREVLVTCDAERRRLVYAVVEGRPSHYNAAVELHDAGDGRTRFVWTVDLLPDALAPAIEQMMRAGIAAMTTTLETTPAG